MKKQTIEQRRAHYCIDHGHSRVITNCFHEKYCGRCGACIGDGLMGSYNPDGKAQVGCECDVCRENVAKMNKHDFAMLKPECAAFVKRMKSPVSKKPRVSRRPAGGRR